jgi:hypothetical protein
MGRSDEHIAAAKIAPTAIFVAVQRGILTGT